MTVFQDHLLPVSPDQAVSPGWTPVTGGRPVGVTWHWTATADLAECRRLIGGPSPERKGLASAHYAVGRTAEEGVDRYVSLEDRSWHAGAQQLLRYNGRSLGSADWKGTRTCVGVESVNLGYERDGVPAGPDWQPVCTPDGQRYLLIQPWTEVQVEMLIEVGHEILARWPHIGLRDHHAHADLCPLAREDVLGFPFATVLRGLYGEDVPDVWSPLWLNRGRQAALKALGYDPGPIDGAWGRRSRAALIRFQQSAGLVVNGLWTSFVSWAIYDRAAAKGLGWPLGGLA